MVDCAYSLKSILHAVNRLVLDYVHTMPAQFEKGEKCDHSKI